MLYSRPLTPTFLALTIHLDYAIFAAASLAEFALIAWLLPRFREKTSLPRLAWPILLCLLTFGYFLVERAGRAAEEKIGESLSRVAPIYSILTKNLDHEKITFDTPATDPAYLKIIEAQKTWLLEDPYIHDIYTMRLNKKGKLAFVVDSETDYDRNGKYQDDREERTDIGEEYEQDSDAPFVALRENRIVFDPLPVNDRWGDWISVWAPIRGSDGKANALLGLDYDAKTYIAEVRTARRGQIIIVALTIGLLAAAMVAIGILQADLHKRQNIERQLRKASDRWQRIVADLPLAYIEWEPDGKVVLCNPKAQEMFGYTKEELMAQTDVRFMIEGEDQAAVVSGLQSLLENGTAYNSLNTNIRADGNRIKCEWVNSPILDSDGKVVSVMSLAQDISEREKLEQQIRQSQKMQSIGELAAGVAHDFNNLLTVIQGHTDLLLLRQDLPREAIDDLDFIADAAERASKLTRQLLTFSRKQAMFARPVNLDQIVNNAVDLLRRVIGDNVKLEKKLHGDLPAINADPSMLDQVLTNLAVNARDAMTNDGTLTISTLYVEITPQQARQHVDAWAGPAVCLKVQDSGCGIPANVLERIFEPFYTTKEVGKGTGLGLSAVHGIVKQHKGWIAVGSQVGKGTEFFMFFPPCEEDVRAENAVVRERIITLESRPEAPRTILLVEDENSVRKLARMALERGGYAVIEAPDGPSAERIWKERKTEINLLLTDMMMPNGVSGRELATRLLVEKPGLPVIYASGYSVELTAPDFKETDTQIFLQKPYIPSRLLEAVRRVLGVQKT